MLEEGLYGSHYVATIVECIQEKTRVEFEEFHEEGSEEVLLKECACRTS